MRLFSVRTSATSDALPAPWPDQCPELKAIEPAAVLRVPLMAQAAAMAQVEAPGTFVPRGKPLAHTPTGVTHAVLAPVSGKVGNVVRVPLLNGQTVPAIELFPDGAAPPETSTMPADDATAIQSASREQLAQWIERLRNLGIWADRPDTPHLLSQLHYVLRNPADTLICSLLDDDPSLCLSSILVNQAAGDMLAGLEFLARLMQVRNVVVAVEAGAPGKWWKEFRKRARKCEFSVVSVVNDYPQSDPTLMIYTLLGRRLKPASLPVEQRVVFLDAAAAAAIGQGVLRGQAMLSVPMAVYDHLARKSHFLDVPIGTPVHDVLRAVGADYADFTLLRGDLLHDNRVSAEAIVAGGELTLHVTPPIPARGPDPCVRCSWCIESCPTRVQVANLLDAAQRNDLDAAERNGLDACIECGVCVYVCPSHLPLLGGIRSLKQDMASI